MTGGDPIHRVATSIDGKPIYEQGKHIRSQPSLAAQSRADPRNRVCAGQANDLNELTFRGGPGVAEPLTVRWVGRQQRPDEDQGFCSGWP
jgi:hypothetical protein